MFIMQSNQTLSKADPSPNKGLPIAAGINTYASPASLERLLASLTRFSRVFVIHGKYPAFVYEDPQSLKNTTEVCRKFPNTQLIDLHATQIEKRNKYLEMAKDFDFLLVVDDDEYAEDLPADLADKLQLIKTHPVLSQYRIFNVECEEPVGTQRRPRLLHKPSTIRYHGKHFWFMLTDKGNKILRGESDCDLSIRGFRLTHDQSSRSEEYIQAKAEYQAWQRWNEQGQMKA
jgi:hypothetical protein